MGKLRKLRTRLISGIGAVKRSVLRRQSQTSNSTVSNPTTTLTRLASLDSAVPASTGARGSKAQKSRKSQVRQEEGDGEIQLHWNEARRIYSEPVQVTQGLSRREDSSTGITVADLHNDSCTVQQEQLDNAIGTMTGSAQDGSQMSDEEDYDDVFLQSWEETGEC